MNSIILAAGEGKRLSPITKNIPKCMVKLFGKTLLQRQIDTMHSCGISDITVVTGYKAESIETPGVHYINNPDYDKTNMVETLFCAKEKLSDEVIVSYGDIIYEKKVLERLIDSKYEISIIVDENWEEYWRVRSENPLDDAETLIINKDGEIVEIGKKTNDIKRIQGQYIGLMKFQNRGVKELIEFYEKSKKEYQKGVNLLNSNIDFRKLYMTDLLQGLIKDGTVLNAIPIHNGWLEIDTVSDYDMYTKLFNDNKLGKFFCENMA